MKQKIPAPRTKLIQTKVVVDLTIEIPEGATHYRDALHDEPLFYKVTMVGGFEHQWAYSGFKKAWLLDGHGPLQGEVYKKIPVQGIQQ